jgi:hypothetical protein
MLHLWQKLPKPGVPTNLMYLLRVCCVGPCFAAQAHTHLCASKAGGSHSTCLQAHEAALDAQLSRVLTC